MADKKFEVGITIGLKDQASAGVRKLSTAFKKTLQPSVKKTGFHFDTLRGKVLDAGRSVVRFATEMIRKAIDMLAKLGAAAVLAGTVLTTELARRGVNAAAEFDYSITKAATMTGEMGEALELTKKRLKAFAKEMAVAAQFELGDIAESFYDLLSAGLSVTELMQTFGGVLALAESTGADLHTTTELLTSTVRAFGLEMSQSNRVANVLAATLSATRATVDRLSIAMPYAATAAKAAGVAVERTAAALGLLMNRGLEASMAGTALRGVLAGMVKPTDEARSMLEKYGLTAKDIDPTLVGFRRALEKLHDASLSYSDMLILFGRRQATAGKILIDNLRTFDDLTAKVTGTNRAFEMQAQMMDTLSAQWKAFKGDVKLLLVTMGEELLPIAREVLAAFRGFAAWLVQTGLAKKYGEALAILARSFIVLITSLVQTGEIQTFFQRGVEAVHNFATVIRELASGRMIQDWITQLRTMIMELAETFRTEGFPAMLQQMVNEIWKIIKDVFSFIGRWIDWWLTYYFGDNWREMRDSIMGIVAAIGAIFTAVFSKKMVAAIQALLPHIAAIVQWLAAVVAKRPLLWLIIGAFVLWIDKIAILVGWAVALYGAIAGAGGVSAAFAIATTSVGAFFVAAWPIIALITAAAAATLLWKRNFDALKEAADATRKSVETTAQTMAMEARAAPEQAARLAAERARARPTIGERFRGAITGGVTAQMLAQQRVHAAQPSAVYQRRMAGQTVVNYNYNIAGSMWSENELDRRIGQVGTRNLRTAGR